VYFDPRDDGPIRFVPAVAPTPQEIDAIAEQVRHRVLRWFARSGLLDTDDVRDMLGWDNGGFSLDASVRIAGRDRAGLERLLRYCARPPFALDRLEQVNAHQIIYRLPKPRRDGRTTVALTPLELIDRLAALIPPPRRHRHGYHGVLAPNAPLRPPTAARRRAAPRCRRTRRSWQPRARRGRPAPPASYLWAMLLACLFESLPLTYASYGADRRIVAFITEAAPLERILTHIGEPAEPRSIASARGPPAWGDGLADAVPDCDTLARPEPAEYLFDQHAQW